MIQLKNMILNLKTYLIISILFFIWIEGVVGLSIDSTFFYYLFKNGDYSNAYVEGLKLKFYNKKYQIYDDKEIYKYIALSLFYTKQYRKSLEYFNKYLNHSATIEDSVFDKIIYIYKNENNFDEMKNILEKYYKNNREKYLLNKAKIAHLEKSYSLELKILDSLVLLDSLKYKDLSENIHIIFNNKPENKSYLKAFIFSLFPTGGYIYTERYSDALFTWITLTPLATLGTLYYLNGDKYRSYIIYSVCGMFYLGTIYGSLVSVKLYNERIEEILYDKVLKEYEKSRKTGFNINFSF